MKSKTALLITLVCVAAMAPATAVATIISFGATFEYSGGAPPAATPSPPWLIAEFDDHGTSGSVTLTLAATNLTGSESVKEWYLNLNPALDPTSLIFSAPTKVGSFDLDKKNPIQLGVNAFKADGDGHFDILISFANSDGDSTRFTAGDSVSYVIDGIPSLTANSFNFTSVLGGGQGTYPMAAHVQNTPAGGDGSGWVSVPEPSALVLLGIGLAGLGVSVSRRGRRAFYTARAMERHV